MKSPEQGEHKKTDEERVTEGAMGRARHEAGDLAELTSTEKREKAAVYEEIAEGLGHLYELLPHNERVAKRKIFGLLEITNLRALSPLMKDRLIDSIADRGLQTATKVNFIIEGVKVLGIWIHTQALGRTATREIDALQLKPKLRERKFPQEGGEEEKS